MRYLLVSLLWFALLGPAMAAAPSPVGILMVYIPADKGTQPDVQSFVTRLKTVRSQSSVPSMPLLAYYYNDDGERSRCQTVLHLAPGDIPCVGVVALDDNGQPTGLISKQGLKSDPAALFKAAVSEMIKRLQAPAPRDLATEITNPKDGSVMELVPGGTFQMGDNDGDDSEKPANPVPLKPFYIAKNLVTNAQFRRFVEATQYPNTAFQEDARKWGDDAPVVHVTWNDAVAYCQWAGARLPTEAEWEKAARGPNPREYPWGNHFIAANAVFHTDGAKPVGKHPEGASPCEALDMAGNVWEWCSTLFKPYPYTPRDGRENLTVAGQRVLRGGCWSSTVPTMLRCESRQGASPDTLYTVIGFRTAKTP